ncbi:MAG: 30S ribosome-binding factor RbfA [Lachnospiraceae bacterium]|nr:30S ribosome-binding factor RbfA [Lachnospiraceae bacterium]
MRKNSIKNTRINGEVQKELSLILQGRLKDPRISPLASVTAVEVAPDLKTCRAYISVLGGEDVLKDTLQGLRKAEGFIRRELARTVNLRNTPAITFLPDTSIAYGISMSKLIDEVSEADARAEEIREMREENLSGEDRSEGSFDDDRQEEEDET